MTAGEWIVWYVTAQQTIYLAAFTVVGFFVVWLLALALSRSDLLAPVNRNSVTAEEYVGFHAWKFAFIGHLLIILCLGVVIFYPVFQEGFDEKWYLAILYLIVLLADLVLILHHNSCMNKCA